MKYNRRLLAIACLFLLPATVPVNAQQITGTPGSPDATQSINGQVLPAPSSPFGGAINLNANQSKPWWAPRIAGRAHHRP
jgi:hypothetical protein